MEWIFTGFIILAWLLHLSIKEDENFLEDMKHRELTDKIDDLKSI